MQMTFLPLKALTSENGKTPDSNAQFEREASVLNRVGRLDGASMNSRGFHLPASYDEAEDHLLQWRLILIATPDRVGGNSVDHEIHGN